MKIFKIALAAVALALTCPTISAKEKAAEVVAAADLNETEQQLVGKWQIKNSENMDGMILNSKSTVNLKADRTYTDESQMKGNMPLGDPDNNMIFIVVEVRSTGTWSAEGTTLKQTPDPESIKTDISVKAKDDSAPGMDQILEQIENAFTTQVIPAMTEGIAEPDESEIVSLVLKTLVLKSTGSDGQEVTATLKRVK